MRGVVYVNLDPAGALTEPDLARGLAALEENGYEVIATDLERLPPTRREIQMLFAGEEPEAMRREAERACAAMLPATPPGAGPHAIGVSFLSSGSQDDVRRIVRGFGVGDQLRDVRLVDDHTAVVVLEPEGLRTLDPSRVQTALEAALNREVHFIAADGLKPI